MMEAAVALMLGSSAIGVGSLFIYLLLSHLGFVRPGLKSPTLKLMKLNNSGPDYVREGTKITFLSPKTILLAAEGGRAVIDTGYFVGIPDGYCGVVVIRTDEYRIATDLRPATDIGTGRTFLPPGFEGVVEVEIWNKSFDEPAGMDAGLPMADLHLIPVPTTLRVVDKI